MLKKIAFFPTTLESKRSSLLSGKNSGDLQCNYLIFDFRRENKPIFLRPNDVYAFGAKKSDI